MAWILLFMQLFLKILNGIANIIDPDQNAPSGAVWSGSILFAYDILSATLVYEILGYLPYPQDVFLKKWKRCQTLSAFLVEKSVLFWAMEYVREQLC